MSNPTIYDQATNAVVKMLETAVTNWHQPWQINGSRNVVTDKQYRGINTLILASAPYPFCKRCNERFTLLSSHCSIYSCPQSMTQCR